MHTASHHPCGGERNWAQRRTKVALCCIHWTVQISYKVNACYVCVLHLRVNTFADSDGKRGYTQLNAPVRTSVFCIATAYMDIYLRMYMPTEV